MPIPGVVQPDILEVEAGLRLRRFDGQFAFALPWYQDEETVYLVDGKRTPYTAEALERMYAYLDAHGELYFIEVLADGIYHPIGDVTFLREDMPIVIGDRRFRGKGIGGKVVAALIARGRALGWDRLGVAEIYDHNAASRRCFEKAGFRACEKTDRGSRFELIL